MSTECRKHHQSSTRRLTQEIPDVLLEEDLTVFPAAILNAGGPGRYGGVSRKSSISKTTSDPEDRRPRGTSRQNTEA